MLQYFHTRATGLILNAIEKTPRMTDIIVHVVKCIGAVGKTRKAKEIIATA
jgi:hypothetical protein